jgi:hypothetical protein
VVSLGIAPGLRVGPVIGAAQTYSEAGPDNSPADRYKPVGREVLHTA